MEFVCRFNACFETGSAAELARAHRMLDKSNHARRKSYKQYDIHGETVILPSTLFARSARHPIVQDGDRLATTASITAMRYQKRFQRYIDSMVYLRSDNRKRVSDFFRHE